MITARELVERCLSEEHWQLWINQYIDDFRRASASERAISIASGPTHDGKFEGLVAAVVSALCRETGTSASAWVAATRSEVPFFPLHAEGYALRIRLMLESPAPFRTRNVFVPETYMSRA